MYILQPGYAGWYNSRWIGYDGFLTPDLRWRNPGQIGRPQGGGSDVFPQFRNPDPVPWAVAFLLSAVSSKEAAAHMANRDAAQKIRRPSRSGDKQLSRQRRSLTAMALSGTAAAAGDDRFGTHLSRQYAASGKPAHRDPNWRARYSTAWRLILSHCRRKTSATGRRLWYGRPVLM